MIIKNYGHYWERNAVHWGTPGHGHGGHLKGYKSARSNSVDFREQIGIYVLYDMDFQPIYVGQAGNGNSKLFARLKKHEDDHLWNRWHHFSWFGFRGVNPGNNKLSDHDKISKQFRSTGKALLSHMEGILIAAMEPKLNKQGASWRGAEQYYQDDGGLESPTPQYLAYKLEVLEQMLKKLTEDMA